MIDFFITKDNEGNQAVGYVLTGYKLDAIIKMLQEQSEKPYGDGFPWDCTLDKEPCVYHHGMPEPAYVIACQPRPNGKPAFTLAVMDYLTFTNKGIPEELQWHPFFEDGEEEGTYYEKRDTMKFFNA